MILLADWLVVVVDKEGHPGLWHLNPLDYLCVCVCARSRACGEGGGEY
jgi:hypothetical protein